jgi:hypothetical protein
MARPKLAATARLAAEPPAGPASGHQCSTHAAASAVKPRLGRRFETAYERCIIQLE